jgi:hypothetical protein
MTYIITWSDFKGGRYQVRASDASHEFGGEIVASAKTRIGAERKLKALVAEQRAAYDAAQKEGK